MAVAQSDCPNNFFFPIPGFKRAVKRLGSLPPHLLSEHLTDDCLYFTGTPQEAREFFIGLEHYLEDTGEASLTVTECIVELAQLAQVSI